MVAQYFINTKPTHLNALVTACRTAINLFHLYLLPRSLMTKPGETDQFVENPQNGNK